MSTLYVNTITTSTSGSTLHVTNNVEARGSLNVVGTVTAGSGTFTGLTADVLDVGIINNESVTVNTVEIIDKLMIVASGSTSAQATGGGLQIGGTDGSDTVASILYDHGNTGIDFNIGGTTELLLTADGFEGKPGSDLGAITGSSINVRGGPITGSEITVNKAAISNTITGKPGSDLGAITGSSINVRGGPITGSDLKLNRDAAEITMGLGTKEIKLIHHDGSNPGLIVKAATSAGLNIGFPTFRLQAADTDITSGNPLGTIVFQAPDDTAGSDAILVAASISAQAEESFSSTVNATKLIFSTAASETATSKMELSSEGNLTVEGDVNVTGSITGKPAAVLGAVTGTHGTFGQVTGSSLKSTGDATVAGSLACARGALSGTTLRVANLTSGRATFATTNGQLTDSAYFTFSEGSGFGQIGGHATRMGAFLGAVTGTHGTFGQITGSSIRLTGSVAITGKPAVQLGAVTGTHGTFGQITGSSLKITGEASIASLGAITGTTLRVANLTSGRATFATTNGQLTDSAYFTFSASSGFGTIDGRSQAVLGAVTGTHGTFGQLTGSSLKSTGDATVAGSLACARGALSGTTLRVANLTSGRATFATTNGQLTDSAYLTFSEGSGFGTLGGKPAVDLGAITGSSINVRGGPITGSEITVNKATISNTITGKPAAVLGAVTGTHGTFGQLTGSSVYASAHLQVGDVANNGGVAGISPYMFEIASEDDNKAIAAMTQYDNDTSGDAPNFYFLRARGTFSSPAVVQDDDGLGSIIFYGHDGTNWEQAATIRCEVDGSPAGDTTDMPGRILFLTSPDGSDTPVERLKIDAAGAITAGTITGSGLSLLPAATIVGKPSADLGAVSGTHGTFGQLTGSSLRLNDGKFINFGTDNDTTLGYNTDYSAPVLDTKSSTFWIVSSTETAEKPEVFLTNTHTNGSSGGHFVFSKSRGWGGAADRAVIANDTLGTFAFRGADGSGGSDTFATIKAVSTDITNNYGEVQMSTSSGSHGPGLDGVSPKTHIARINGEVVTTILIDIGAGGIISSNAAGDVIGADDAAGSYLTRVTTAVNGVVYRGEMACVEVPTTGDADINLTANAAVLAEDAAGEGEHVLVNGGTWTLGAKVDLTIPSGGIVNDYLYLTHGGSTAGTYNAGKYIIKLYGADF
jgi:hypothetical protein